MTVWKSTEKKVVSDAAYLELAVRESLMLASLDRAMLASLDRTLVGAEEKAGVVIYLEQEQEDA